MIQRNSNVKILHHSFTLELLGKCQNELQNFQSEYTANPAMQPKKTVRILVYAALMTSHASLWWYILKWIVLSKTQIIKRVEEWLHFSDTTASLFFNFSIQCVKD